MQRKINLSIPKPCHENWQEMTPLEKGRFCDSCEKQVFDFTKSSDREIFKKFNSEKDICGRFSTKQLERDIAFPKEKSTFWIAGVSGILSFLSLGNQDVFSQEKVNIEQTDQKKTSAETATGNSAAEIKVSGVVFEEQDGNPLAGASIINMRNSFQTESDSDGNFSLLAQKGDVIEITYYSMIETIVVSTEKKLEIILRGNELDEVFLAGMIVQRKRTFFERIFNSIGNIFR